MIGKPNKPKPGLSCKARQVGNRTQTIPRKIGMDVNDPRDCFIHGEHPLDMDAMAQPHTS